MDGDKETIHISLEAMRENYRGAPLDETVVSSDAVSQFAVWFIEARESGTKEPNAMTLATVDESGRPAARIVLLKEFGGDGFYFYTNYGSRKARELDANPYVALVFYWPELERQVRIEGITRRATAEQSAAYFRKRPRGSQLGALASHQSAVVKSRTILEARLSELESRYRDVEDVPAPSFWGGYCVKPNTVEFWQGRPNRLHDRLRYRRTDAEEWILERLEP